MRYSMSRGTLAASAAVHNPETPPRPRGVAWVGLAEGPLPAGGARRGARSGPAVGLADLRSGGGARLAQPAIERLRGERLARLARERGRALEDAAQIVLGPPQPHADGLLVLPEHLGDLAVLEVVPVAQL